MTKLQMTNAELNRALAELMGYSVKRSNNKFRLHLPENTSGWTYNSEESAWEDAPDYCADPAASIEVQAAAIAANKVGYLNNLLSLVSPGEDIQFGLGGSMEVVGYNIDGTSAMLVATPRQRAEAAYMTLQGAQ